MNAHYTTGRERARNDGDGFREVSVTVDRRTVLAGIAGGAATIGHKASAAASAGDAGHVVAVTSVAWLEGPAVAEDGSVFFSDVKANRIYRLAPGASRAEVFRDAANYPNGAAIDAQNRLLTCEAGDPATGTPPRVTRTDLGTGAMEVLIDEHDGRRLLGPNDVRVDSAGRIFFTDGDRPGFIAPWNKDVPAANGVGVYRIDPDGRAHRILAAPVIVQPNGLGISADRTTLFLIENDPGPGGRRQLLRFALSRSGEASARTVLHDFGDGRSGDSMTVDHAGDLLVCAGLNRLRGDTETLSVAAGVHIFSAAGEAKGFIPVPEDSVTNVAESRAEPGLLYVTAGHTLFKVRR